MEPKAQSTLWPAPSEGTRHKLQRTCWRPGQGECTPGTSSERPRTTRKDTQGTGEGPRWKGSGTHLHKRGQVFIFPLGLGLAYLLAFRSACGQAGLAESATCATVTRGHESSRAEGGLLPAPGRETWSLGQAGRRGPAASSLAPSDPAPGTRAGQRRSLRRLSVGKEAAGGVPRTKWASEGLRPYFSNCSWRW